MLDGYGWVAAVLWVVGVDINPFLVRVEILGRLVQAGFCLWGFLGVLFTLC